MLGRKEGRKEKVVGGKGGKGRGRIKYKKTCEKMRTQWKKYQVWAFETQVSIARRTRPIPNE